MGLTLIYIKIDDDRNIMIFNTIIYWRIKWSKINKVTQPDMIGWQWNLKFFYMRFWCNIYVANKPISHSFIYKIFHI